GAATLASTPAAAQRCGTANRTKGPVVWLDMDQHELDEAYDQSVYAFNQNVISERRAANNEKALAIIGKPERLPYGNAEIEQVDIYKSKRPNAPVLVYIHGGAWRGGRSAQLASMAEPYIKAGAHYVAVDFNNVLETKGDLFPMVDQVRRATAWVYRNAASFGGRPHQGLLA